MKFKQPPKTRNFQGEIRKVGFEFEFSGLDLEETANIITKEFGGRFYFENRYTCKITGSTLGDISLDVDTVLLKEKTYQEELKKLGIDLEKMKVEAEVENAIEAIASTFVPYEVVLSPLSLNELDKVEKLRELLYKHKAKGTSASLIYAFGLHINPELPEISVKCILNYLRAFILLVEWIIEKSSIDFTRRYLTAFINDYPDRYKLAVLDSSYSPSMDELVEDYKLLNNTRNRALDFYPLFAYINPDYSKGIKKEELVKPRPALHYRLPNCMLNDPNWRVAEEWNKWIEVEQLAWNEEKIEQMSKQYLNMYGSELFFRKRWSESVEQFIHD